MKTVTFDQNLFVITTTVSGNDVGTAELYYTKDLSVKMSNNQTLQVIYQGKSVFNMSSDPNSPFAGNNINGTDQVNSAFQDLKSEMSSK